MMPMDKKLFYCAYHQRKFKHFSNVLSIDVRSDGLLFCYTFYEAGLLKALFQGETIFKQVPFFNGKEMKYPILLQAVTMIKATK